jgi:putative ABC transport system substrate-binding protein
MRRTGVLMTTAADDPQGQAQIAAFLQGLHQLGWSDGRNVRIDTRWGVADTDRIRKYAAELLALAPDVILTVGTGSRGPLLQATRAMPVLGHPLRDPDWLLGGGFCRSRCWLGFHNRIGNRLRNIDGFRAGLMGTNHAPPP